MTPRLLIVNADDFGQSAAINRGIVRARAEGIVTSASLMVRQPAAGEAAEYARDYPGLSVGLHADLAAWARRGGTWEPVYERVDLDDAAAVQRELEEQLGLFRELIGAEPTHVDSHQHVHRSQSVARVFRGFAGRLDVPLRHFAPMVAYRGDFYGRTKNDEPYPEGIGVEGLVRTLRGLPPGVTELGCHPGEDERADPYGAERTAELAALCDPRVREVLRAEQIELRSFADFDVPN